MASNFTFWMHGDIVNLQARLKAALDGTNQSVASCAALDAPTSSSWASFYQAASQFVNQPANWLNTGAQATQGQAIEQELVAWQEKLSGSCQLTVPIYTPTPVNTTASQVIGYGLIAASGLTGAWAFNKASGYLLSHSATKAKRPLSKARRRHRTARHTRHHAHA